MERFLPPLITSRQNNHVRELRAALSGRRNGGIVAIEGMHLLEEALSQTTQRTGLQVRSIFLREDQQNLAEDLPADIEILLLSQDAFDSAAATEHSQGVAALLLKPEVRYLPEEGDLLLVAAGLQDPGNLGTLIRSAEAFGASAVVLTTNTVDPWNGKSLRASAGSVFRMPLLRGTDPLWSILRAKGIRLLAAVPPAQGATPIHKVDLASGCAILVGNEGSGIPADLLTLADERVTLLTPGPTESLNAAVAGSLLLYEAMRQRS